MSAENQIRTYILENFLFSNRAEGLSNDDSFLQQGILDSTGVLELVTFIEANFNITVNDEELIPENLDSVNNLVNFIHRKNGN